MNPTRRTFLQTLLAVLAPWLKPIHPGETADVRLFDVALTEQEVRSLYRFGYDDCGRRALETRTDRGWITVAREC